MATPRGIYEPDGSTVVDIEAIAKQLAQTADAAIGAATAALSKRVKSGVVAVTIAAGQSAGEAPVLFGTQFAGTPRVTTDTYVSLTSGGYASRVSGSPTVNGFTAALQRPPGAATTAAVTLNVFWIATDLGNS